MQILLAGGKPADEPDWFGVSYQLPIDPRASIDEQLRQWNALVQPAIDAELAAGNIRRERAGD